MGDVGAVGGCGRKWDDVSTEEMMDQVARDANVRKPGEDRLRTGAMHKTHAEVRTEQRHEREDVEHHAVNLLKEKAPAAVLELVAHKLIERGAAHAAAVAVGGMALGAEAAFGLYFGVKEGIIEPKLRGEALRNAQDNDAVNGALAGSLAFLPEFANAQVAERADVERGIGNLRGQLHGKDRAMLPVLQARADQGVIAAERAFRDAQLAPTAERGAAFQRSLVLQGFGDRLRTDVAFGKGVEYGLWLHTSKDAATVKAELGKVQARTVEVAHQCPVRG